MTSTLSYPSKMPCPSFNLPAKECVTGSQLAKVPGSVCSKCYALKGRYNFPNVQRAMKDRMSLVRSKHFVPTMVAEITKSGANYFRWHDSGDLQSVSHLVDIVTIAESLPHVKFWLPTREKQTVERYLRHTLRGGFPPNLTVRVSGAMINGPAPRGFPNTSTVVSNPAAADCPATTVRNTCGPCRRCWDPRVKNVAYLEH